MDIVEAPFNADQVSALLRWQDSTMVHPLTCPNRNDGEHRAAEYGRQDIGTLWVYREHLLCPDCQYEQTWAPEICTRTGVTFNPFYQPRFPENDDHLVWVPDPNEDNPDIGKWVER